MILRLIINLVRWTWGYPSLATPEVVDEATALMMMFGALLDVGALVGIVGLTITWIKQRKGGAS